MYGSNVKMSHLVSTVFCHKKCYHFLQSKKNTHKKPVLTLKKQKIKKWPKIFVHLIKKLFFLQPNKVILNIDIKLHNIHLYIEFDWSYL